MGLDNGIRFKEKIKEVPIGTPFFLKERLTDEICDEVCYWRKCWGLRGEIMRMLHAEEQTYTYLEPEDVSAIRRIIIGLMNPTRWEEDGGSIWEFEEIAEQLTYDIIALSWLEEYMLAHPDEKVYFYDSY